MQTPFSYFTEHNLFDLNNLNAYAEHHGVHVITSERFPDLVLLKYKDEVQWGDKPWIEFARMSRGLVVDMKNQTILAHGFDKFFNLGQMIETNYEILKEQKQFEVSEKLDGSCLVSFHNPKDGQIYLTTTGSFDSEHGQVGTELLRNHLSFYKICDYAELGTLIFELIDSRFRIVIDYFKKGYDEGLYLIGYRDPTGRLYTYAEVAELALQLGLPCMKIYQFDSLDHLMSEVAKMTVLDEGFVLRYPDGLMVKIKSPAYLQAHRFISRLSDKNILESVVEGSADELALLAPEEYRQDVLDTIAYFKQQKEQLINESYIRFSEAPKDNGRKEFALWVIKNVKPHLTGCLFQLMDGKQLQDKDLYKIVGEIEKPSVETRI